MGLTDIVECIFQGISLRKAVVAVFGLDENPETNAVGIERFISANNNYVLKNGIEVERYLSKPNIFIFNDSINLQMSYLVSAHGVKEVATFSWTSDSVIIQLSYASSLNTLAISVAFPSSYEPSLAFPEWRQTHDPLYSPDYFFQLTKLSNIDELVNAMNSCKFSMEITEEDQKTKNVSYKIGNIQSQELLSVFVEYIHSLLFYKNGSFDLIKNLRRHGVFLPAVMDIDMKKAIDDCFPAARFYSEMDHRWLSINFGKKSHPDDPQKSCSAIGVEITSNLGIPTHPHLKDLENAHIYVTFQSSLLPNAHQRYEYGQFLLQELRRKGFENERFAEYETFAFWENIHPGGEIDLEFNLPATSQRQLEDLFSAFARMYHRIEHVDSNSLLRKLLEQNIAKQDAYAIIETIHDDFKVISIVDHQSDKNRVYYLQDKSGNKKVIKVMADQKAAEIETIVLAAFAKHPVLSQYVPRCYTAEPIAVEIGKNQRYIIIQEDVRKNEEQLFERMLLAGNKKQAQFYLESWVRTLARIHYYGTQLFNDIGCSLLQKTASRFASEKHEERIISSAIVYDSGLRNAILSASVKQGSSFIHGDLRFENRLGSYAIDWDHAARGNPLMDLAQLFVDPRLGWMRFGEEQQKQFLALYLSETRRIEAEDKKMKSERVSQQEIEKAYFEFAALRVLYTQSQTAYLLALSDQQQNRHPNGSSLSLQNARETAAFLQYKLPAFEAVVRRI
ncbi:phosphotransferase [Candidatus Woesearchaeota archaeon]|nr:phosphotransferase [Candidatus Woesearchaeota archaeon]